MAATAVPLDTFIQVVGVLLTLSVASERFVEIIKGYLPFLNETRADEKAEARRKSHVLIFSTIVNMGTTYLAWDLVRVTPAIDKMGDHWYVMVGFALLSTGGSSLWNNVLSYLTGMKEIKKSEANTAKLETAQAASRYASSPTAIQDQLFPVSLESNLGGAGR